jgi:hypothetical protein
VPTGVPASPPAAVQASLGLDTPDDDVDWLLGGLADLTG